MAYKNPSDKKKYQQVYYQKNKTAMKDAAKKYYSMNRANVLIVVARYRLKNRDSIREYLKRYHHENKADIKKKNEYYLLERDRYHSDEEYRKKEIIRATTWNKYGTLLKTECCAECGTKERLTFHHRTYIVDDFVILCQSCHKELHYRTRSLKALVEV